MSALPLKADIVQHGAAQKERDRHNGRPPKSLVLAFSNNWRRWGFALAVVPVSVLCASSDAKDSQRRCRQ